MGTLLRDGVADTSQFNRILEIAAARTKTHAARVQPGATNPERPGTRAQRRAFRRAPIPKRERPRTPSGASASRRDPLKTSGAVCFWRNLRALGPALRHDAHESYNHHNGDDIGDQLGAVGRLAVADQGMQQGGP